MTSPHYDDALHMMEGKGEAGPDDASLLHVWDAYVGEPTAERPLKDADKLAFARALLQRFPKTSFAHWVDEVEASGEAEKQTQIALLAECRSHLPLAAASWNDDEDRTVATFHVNRILDLIKRLDAALAKVQS